MHFSTRRSTQQRVPGIRENRGGVKVVIRMPRNFTTSKLEKLFRPQDIVLLALRDSVSRLFAVDNHFFRGFRSCSSLSPSQLLTGTRTIPQHTSPGYPQGSWSFLHCPLARARCRVRSRPQPKINSFHSRARLGRLFQKHLFKMFDR